MNIILNGEEFQLNGENSVSDLAKKLELDLKKIAIEKNLEIIPRSKFDSTEIIEGDQIEIVSFIGGG